MKDLGQVTRLWSENDHTGVGIKASSPLGGVPGRLETNPEARLGLLGATRGSTGLTNTFETEAKSGLLLT